MSEAGEAHGRAFAAWLRTGRWPVEPVERKFNPYHDPRNGQFTFAPGGPRSLERVIVSERRPRERERGKLPDDGASLPRSGARDARGGGTLTPAVFQPGTASAALLLAVGRPRGTRPTRGDNGGPPPVPMTLQQAIPGLASAPAGAVLAVADQALGIYGPAVQLSEELHRLRLNRLREQIHAIDADYPIPQLSIGRAITASAQAKEVEQLLRHLDRVSFTQAANIFKATGDYRPLQVQTRKFVQDATDEAYDLAIAKLRSGKLRTAPTIRMAVGNEIDRRVRLRLRLRFKEAGIDAAGPGPVSVNRREHSGDEGSFRVPDSRVGSMFIDVTLAAKTPNSAQVRGFFTAASKPDYVVIIRPSQLGRDSSYIILRKDGK